MNDEADGAVEEDRRDDDGRPRTRPDGSTTEAIRNASPPMPPGRRMPPACASIESRQTSETRRSIAREREERTPPRRPYERARGVEGEKPQKDVEARSCECRQDSGLAAELPALAAVDGDVAAPEVEDASGRGPRHGDVRRMGRPRIPAAVPQRDDPGDERQRDDGQAPGEHAHRPPRRPRLRGHGRRFEVAHDVVPARAIAGQEPRSVRMTPSSYPTAGAYPSTRRALAMSNAMGSVITSSFS